MLSSSLNQPPPPRQLGEEHLRKTQEEDRGRERYGSYTFLAGLADGEEGGWSQKYEGAKRGSLLLTRRQNGRRPQDYILYFT